MRRLLAVIVSVFISAFAVVLGLPATAALATAGDGFIERYEVNITINADSSLDVTERIAYTFTDSSHGIYRNIPNRYPVPETFTPAAGQNDIDSSYDRVIEISDIQVSSPSGAPTDLDVSQQGDQLVLRVGNPDRTINGEHSYVLSYHVVGAMNSFDDHDELYWNAIGGDWLVPIRSASVKVTAPAVNKARCFAGLPGLHSKCDGLTVTSQSTSATAENLTPGAAMTMVVGLPKGSSHGHTTDLRAAVVAGSCLCAFAGDDWLGWRNIADRDPGDRPRDLLPRT